MIKTFVLLTTAVLGPGGREAFRDMLASVSTAQATDPGLEITVVIVFQGALEPLREELRSTLPRNVTPIFADRRLGTAQARNIGLAYFAENFVGSELDEIIVALPDDDVVFAPGLFQGLARIFDGEPDLDIVLVGSGLPISPEPMPTRAAPVSTYGFIRRATSNTAYLRGRLLQRPRSFNEDLGPLTPTEGGEDSEFMLAMARRSRRIGMLDNIYVGHRPETVQHTARYFMGSTLALRSHLDWNTSIKLVFARKLLVGAYFVLTGRMRLTNLLRTLGRCATWRGH